MYLKIRSNAHVNTTHNQQGNQETYITQNKTEDTKSGGVRVLGARNI
jgi:hypothetical protein